MVGAIAIDVATTPAGDGYRVVTLEGAVRSYGLPDIAVLSLVPDPDGSGYWLVASDGGIFAFDAPFRGSMGDRRLNRPVTGMVPFGNGYLMVSADGGIFNFSDRPFVGSLGADPPASPIVAVGALR